MKLTKSKLKQIIKEELEKALNETGWWDRITGKGTRQKERPSQEPGTVGHSRQQINLGAREKLRQGGKSDPKCLELWNAYQEVKSDVGPRGKAQPARKEFENKCTYDRNSGKVFKTA